MGGQSDLVTPSIQRLVEPDATGTGAIVKVFFSVRKALRLDIIQSVRDPDVFERIALVNGKAETSVLCSEPPL